MDTLVFTKKKFIKWLSTELSDDQVVLMSAELTGSTTLNKKRNEKLITFGLAADAFKRKDDIGHLAFRQTPCVAICICNQGDVSEKTLEVYNATKKTK